MVSAAQKRARRIFAMRVRRGDFKKGKCKSSKKKSKKRGAFVARRRKRASRRSGGLLGGGLKGLLKTAAIGAGAGVLASFIPIQIPLKEEATAFVIGGVPAAIGAFALKSFMGNGATTGGTAAGKWNF